MVFPLKPPFSYGFPMVFPLKPPFSYGFPMVFLWFSQFVTRQASWSSRTRPGTGSPVWWAPPPPGSASQTPCPPRAVCAPRRREGLRHRLGARAMSSHEFLIEIFTQKSMIHHRKPKRKASLSLIFMVNVYITIENHHVQWENPL